ncbi:MAG: phosphoribosylanthranilate isomerase [Cyclobacteriaceae bacterium]|nr:phosphoribosylanthranilate isomerase [Cyclobacteriaceae bacterium]MCH8516582.1 phosphoribosylanthranilate isomerase [Cyclobacteriaceae bacterium]
MELKTKVKVSGINNLSDARYCAGMGVHFQGFNLEEGTEGAISPQVFSEISGWLSGVDFVAEFSNATKETIRATIDQLEGLKFIQIRDLNQKIEGLGIFYAINCSPTQDISDIQSQIKALSGKVDYFILESDSEWSKEELIALLNALKDEPVFFGMNIPEEFLADLIERDIFGIGLKGGEEERPGYKNFDDLADILEALELED